MTGPGEHPSLGQRLPYPHHLPAITLSSAEPSAANLGARGGVEFMGGKTAEGRKLVDG